MPWVSSRPTGQQDGSIITQFTNTTGTSFVTYNYPSSQSSIIIENKSLNDIFINVGNVTNQLIKSYAKWKYEGSFDSFSIRSDVNSQEFTATALYKELQDFSQINGKMNDLETKVNTATSTLAENMTYTASAESSLKSGKIPVFISKLKSGTAKYAILGDSITDTWAGLGGAGGGASNAAHGYPQLLKASIQNIYGTGITFDNLGIGGQRTKQMYDRLDTDVIPKNYDLVIVEAGTNDWNNGVDLTTFEIHYRALVEKIMEKSPNADILCVTLGYFDTHTTAFSIGSESLYNAVIRNLCAEWGIGVIDTREAMKRAIRNGKTFADITYALDPVHPNDAGHKLWADEFLTWFIPTTNLVSNPRLNKQYPRYLATDSNIKTLPTWSVVASSVLIGGNYLVNNVAGHKAFLKFKGEKVIAYLNKFTNLGKVRISVDGEIKADNVDLYSATFTTTFITIENLKAGSHILEIEILNDKNASSTSIGCQLNMILVCKSSENEDSALSKNYITPDEIKTRPVPNVSFDTNVGYYFGRACFSTFLMIGYGYGTKIKIYYPKGTSYGIADVYVDGVLKGTLDMYNASFTKQNVFEITGLSAENHIVQLIPNGKNTSSSGTNIGFEGLLFYGNILTYKTVGTDAATIPFNFYETPFIQVTPIGNFTAYIDGAATNGKQAVIKTNPAGGNFNFKAEGY